MKIGLRVDKQEERKMMRLLNKLPEKVFIKHVGKAASKSMTPVSRTAKKLVAKDEGKLKKAIGKKRKIYKRSGAVWVGVGPRKGKGAPHGRLVEFGHRVVTGGTTARISGRRKGKSDAARDSSKTGKGAVGGFVKARPFLRPALRQNQDKVFRTYKEELRKGVKQEAQKLA